MNHLEKKEIREIINKKRLLFWFSWITGFIFGCLITSLVFAIKETLK